MKNTWWEKTGPPINIMYTLSLNDYFRFVWFYRKLFKSQQWLYFMSAEVNVGCTMHLKWIIPVLNIVKISSLNKSRFMCRKMNKNKIKHKTPPQQLNNSPTFIFVFLNQVWEDNVQKWALFLIQGELVLSSTLSSFQNCCVFNCLAA